MDFLAFSLSFSLLWLFIYLLRPLRVAGNLPPGPWPLPVVGNILNIGAIPHQGLARLSQKYGPVMSLKLGINRMVVISSPAAAQEALQKNDQVLSGRPILNALTVFDYHKYSLVWLPAVAAKWKSLRRVCAMQVFSPRKLDITEPLRQKKLDELQKYLHESAIESRAVDIGKAGFTTILNMVSNTLFSLDLGCYGNFEASTEIMKLMWDLQNTAGTPNISDFFPALQFLDLQGLHRRMSIYVDRLFKRFDGIISEKTLTPAKSTSAPDYGFSCTDVLDSLLDLEHDGELCRNEIKCLLMDLLVGGVETSQATLEWAMAELMKNPGKMARAKAELERVIAKGTKVRESNISELPYLQAVIKETFRLHPTIPLLLPHKAETQVNLCGFDLPKNAQVMFNLWAMGREPNVWEDPMQFEPERFLETEIDLKGKNFELIPFAAGRRICPGLPLAIRMVTLTLASMVHSFDWKLANGETAESLDVVNEKVGLGLRMGNPLYVIPVVLSSNV